MTTIAEVGTVDEGHLVPALRARCVLADTNAMSIRRNGNPQNVRPRNVNPQGRRLVTRQEHRRRAVHARQLRSTRNTLEPSEPHSSSLVASLTSPAPAIQPGPDSEEEVRGPRRHDRPGRPGRGRAVGRQRWPGGEPTANSHRDHRPRSGRLSDHPSDSYCNRFSAYWHAGTADCGNDNRSEEWCADFAAWVWKRAGAEVLYELAPNFLNSDSASFFVWGLDHGRGTRSPRATSPEPGDVAIYGLDATAVTAQHVAIVTSATARDDATGRDQWRRRSLRLQRGRGRDQPVLRRRQGPWRPLCGYVSPSEPSSGGRAVLTGEAARSQLGAPQPGVYPAGRAIDFFSRKVSKPFGPNSRPTPDSLYPPNGVAEVDGRRCVEHVGPGADLAGDAETPVDCRQSIPSRRARSSSHWRSPRPARPRRRGSPPAPDRRSPPGRSSCCCRRRRTRWARRTSPLSKALRWVARHPSATVAPSSWPRRGTLDARPLTLGHERADLGRWVHRVADRHAGHAAHQGIDDFVVAGRGARIRVCATQAWPLFMSALGNRAGIVVERSASSRMMAADLPAELERAALQPLTADPADALAPDSRPGEGDLVDAGVA